MPCLIDQTRSSPMGSTPPRSPPNTSTHAEPSCDSERDQISQNIAAVLDFYQREDRKISGLQRWLEQLSLALGQPMFMGGILVFVLLWVVINLLLPALGWAAFDPAPFFWLQGLVGLGALLTATVVLGKQNRFAKLAEQRAHLDLKVTLLTEQKAAKLIDLMEELRRDLPNVRDRNDANAQELQQPMTPVLVLAALDERGSLDAPHTSHAPPDHAAEPKTAMPPQAP
jgi:uncharacterized membrane protein